MNTAPSLRAGRRGTGPRGMPLRTQQAEGDSGRRRFWAERRCWWAEASEEGQAVPCGPSGQVAELTPPAGWSGRARWEGERTRGGVSPTDPG